MKKRETYRDVIKETFSISFRNIVENDKPFNISHNYRKKEIKANICPVNYYLTPQYFLALKPII